MNAQVTDRALILTGFAGAFRRSELAAIQVRDVAIYKDAFVIELLRSKTDQEGKGRKVAIPRGSNRLTCPVHALKHWLKVAGISNGAVFRSVNRYDAVASKGLNSDSIAFILKKAAARAGMKTESIAGHSLRAGFVTQAAKNGVPDRQIMKQTGHKSLGMLQRYIRDSQILEQNPASRLGI